jgi:hypothetical protein
MTLKLAAAAALLGLSAPAYAADWYYVDASTQHTDASFIDMDSVVEDAAGKTRAAMFSVLAQVEEGAIAYRFIIELDCKANTSRLRSGEGFGPDKASLGVDEIPGDWEPTAPGSQGATISKFVCTRGASNPASKSLGAAFPFEHGRKILADHRAAKGK